MQSSSFKTMVYSLGFLGSLMLPLLAQAADDVICEENRQIVTFCEQQTTEQDCEKSATGLSKDAYSRLYAFKCFWHPDGCRRGNSYSAIYCQPKKE